MRGKFRQSSLRISTFSLNLSMLWAFPMPCSSPGTSLCFKTQPSSVKRSLPLTKSIRFSKPTSLKSIFLFFLSHSNLFGFRAIKNKCFFIKNWNEEMIYFLVWLISVCEIIFYKSFYEYVQLKKINSSLFHIIKLQRLHMNGKSFQTSFPKAIQNP